MSFKKLVSATLSALIIMQTVSLPAYASYNEGNMENPVIESRENEEVFENEIRSDLYAAGVQLQSGSAFISSEATDEEIKNILFEALYVNKEGVDPRSVDWEFYGTGYEKTGISRSENWVSVLEGGSWKKGPFKVTYTCSALKNQNAGTYRVRIAGTSDEAEFTKIDKSNSSVSLRSGVSVELPYTQEGNMDIAALYSAVFSQLVENITPELNLEDVKIEYYAKAESGAIGGIGKNWVPLEGGTVDLLKYPAISSGENNIRISWGGNAQYKGFSAEASVVFTERPQAPYELNNPIGNVNMIVNEDLSYNFDAIRENVFNAIIASSDVIKNDANVSIEYYAAPAVGSVGNIGKNWVPLQGGKASGLAYPAVSEGTWKVRISYAGNDTYAPTVIEAEVKFIDREASVVSLREGVSIALPYTEEGELDITALYTEVFSQLVENTTPELTREDVKIEYYAKAESGSVGDIGKSWAPLEGGTIDKLNYPSLPAGENQIRISWAGNTQYKGFKAEAAVIFTERPQAPYELNDPVGTAKLVVNDDLSYNYAETEKNVFDAVIASSDVINYENVKIEYHAETSIGSVGNIGKNWAPLEGGKVSGISYPAVSEGTWKVRIIYKGNSEYAPTFIEAEVNFTDRPTAVITEKNPDTVYEIGMVFNNDLSYNFDDTAKAIYDAVVASATASLEDGTEVNIPYDAMRIEYNTDRTGITKNFVPLTDSDLTGLVKFGLGNWEIRISCLSTVEYRGGNIIVKINAVDNRLPSSIVFNEGNRITYNMYADTMKQDILDSCINFRQSQLPDANTLGIENFEFQYKGLSLITENVPEDWKPQKGWAPLEGGQGCEITNIALPYPQMGAGENQEIRISFKGNAEYRPSEAPQEGILSVDKATVAIKVRATNIDVGAKMPSDMVTIDPADSKIDIYTVYGGLTSDVTTSIYLDLPDKYSQNGLIVKVIDPVVESIYGKSFSRILNEGISLGELRILFSNEALLDILDKLNIDTGAVGQILKVLNKLPAVTDSIRVAFGTPENNAGLYVVTAVTENKNYKTAVGTGMLLVKMSATGNKINWNRQLPKKITVEEARNFDFGATLSHNGDTSVEQNLHVLYSGFTSRWRAYSSTTTPPTEPGRYVMTVVTLGGNYLAPPVTRSFQIVR